MEIISGGLVPAIYQGTTQRCGERELWGEGRSDKWAVVEVLAAAHLLLT
jgi:hypothetical protein